MKGLWIYPQAVLDVRHIQYHEKITTEFSSLNIKIARQKVGGSFRAHADSSSRYLSQKQIL